MTRVRVIEESGQVPGRLALPAPRADAAALRRCAHDLAQAGAEAAATPTVRGALATLLPQVWAGEAATAAVVEASELSRRSRLVLDGVPAASGALLGHAASIEEATATIQALQQQWDAAEADHTRERLQIEARLSEPERTRAVTLARDRHEAAKARLSARHEAAMEELDRSQVRVAARLEAIDGVGFTRATSVDGIRHDFVQGLPMAAGALSSGDARVRGLGAAVAWRALGPDPSAAQVDSFVRTYGAAATDPAFAQAFVDEVGVANLLGVVTEHGRIAGPASIETTRQLIGVVGTLVYSAAAGASVPGTDPATRARLASGGVWAAEDLERAMGATFTSSDGRTRHSGYWLAGQLLVGARASGRATPLPSGLVARIAGAAAAGEIAEARDGDLERRHGTSMRPDGGAQFASYFEDPNSTGDALHQVLASVATDPASQSVVLTAVVDQPLIANSRGGQLILAEYLVRRWQTHEAGLNRATPDLRLATGDDLGQMMAGVGAGGGEVAAVLRARVMAEVARTNAHSRHEYTTILQYEANSARIEGDSVDWLLAMPGSVSATLAVPPGAQGGYTTSAATDAGISPALTVQELTGLVSAYAVSADFHAGAKDPAANHQRLIAGELARLRAEVAAGASDAELATAVERIGYLDGVASGALIELAQQQDAVNRSMWETIAEAKNGTLGILRGPGATVDVVQSVITQGTTRSALDDAVITRIRSDLAAEQAEANQARGAALARALSAIHVPERAGAGSVEMQLLRGARLAPTAPTVAEIRSARHAELAGHLTDHTYGSADSHTSAAVTRHDQMRVRSGVKGERPTPGTVVVPAGVKPLPHERATAESLAAAGRDVEFIRATTMGRTPDALVDGVRWELKAIKGDGPGTVIQERRRQP